MGRLQCNRTLIASLGVYTDLGGSAGDPFIQCQSPTASCLGAGFTTITPPTYCTDFSTSVQISSGALIQKRNLSRTTNIVVGYTGSRWPSQVQMANGISASAWRVVARIDLGQGYPINSSPSKVLIHYIVKPRLCHVAVTGTLPIHRVREGQSAVIQFPVSDWDTSNDLRCRWANSAGAAGDECGDVCANLPGATLSAK